MTRWRISSNYRIPRIQPSKSAIFRSSSLSGGSKYRPRTFRRSMSASQRATDVGVMLVGRTSLPWVTLSEDGGIDLGDHRPSIGNTPPIKRPKVDPITGLLLNSSQPGESSVGGAGDLPLDVEVEGRLGRRGPPVGETELIVGSRSRVALPQIKDAYCDLDRSASAGKSRPGTRPSWRGCSAGNRRRGRRRRGRSRR